MKGDIELEGMVFHSYHGCLPFEKEEGNTFVVDFRARTDVGKAALSDNLDDTLDYGAVYDIVAGEMAIPSNLLENVAGRILNAIAEAFPLLEDFSVRVSKKNPPVAGAAAWSRVTVYHNK